MRRGPVVAVLGFVLLGLAPAAGAQDDGPPVGSEVVVDLPRGDVHVDEGLPAQASRRADVDAVAVRGTWAGDRVLVELDVAGSVFSRAEDEAYSLVFTLMDLSGQMAETVALAVWDGERGFGFAGNGMLEDCGGRLAGLRGATTVELDLPQDCLGDASTIWLNVQALQTGAVNFGDALLAGDEALWATEVVAVLHAPDAEPQQRVASQDEQFGEAVADEDPSNERIVWRDEDGADGGLLGLPLGGGGDELDLVEVEVVDGADGIRVTHTFADDAPDDLSVTLAIGSASSMFAMTHLDFGEAANGDPELAPFLQLPAMFTRPGDWGLRACRAQHQVDGPTLTTRVAATCPASGTYEEGLSLAFASGSVGFGADALYGTTTWTRPARPLVVAATARDVSATCNGQGRDFSDTADNFHAASIRCIAGRGITQGRGDGSYGPKDVLTRGQIATFILRTIQAAGIDVPPGSGACRGSVHAESLDRLAGAGIMPSDGCNIATVVTRSEMATITAGAVRYAGIEVPTPTHWFTDDRGVSPDVELAHDTVAELGIVTGTGKPGVFGGPGELRRDQMATFLARLLDVLRAT